MTTFKAPEHPLCEDCETRYAVEGEVWCPDCRDNRAERAYESFMERYYGGGEPITMDEIHAAAWKQKQELK